MRIAMVSEHASPLVTLGEVDAGGQNVHVAELSAGMARRGHDVTVYTRREDPDLSEEVHTLDGVQVVHIDAGPPEPVPKDELLPHMGDFARRLDQLWSAQPPDLVHAHFWMSGLASVLATRELEVPVVQTFHALGSVKRAHQGNADTSPEERIKIERMVGRRANRVIATCSDEVFELVRLGVPRTHISVVPCGVDTTVFTPDGPAEPRTESLSRLVALGRLVPRKGIDTMISALPALPGTELLVAGGPPAGQLCSDPEAERLREHALSIGVADRVHLLGQLEHTEVAPLLRSADAVVCTPWYEPFGIVPLEAMACGVPVVATAVGGLTDTVVDGITGRLVPPHEPAQLARTLRSLLGDGALRAGYGAAGCDRVRARYSWERITTDTQRLYQRACPPGALVPRLTAGARQ